MSPLTVRRYRAERLLRKEFEGLRGRVLGTVRGRLRASGVSLDASDLEACYAQAWQGLYAAMLAGEEIANPTGWLALVTFRRAIEEHRSRRRGYPTRASASRTGSRGGAAAGAADGRAERDFAAELDDRDAAAPAVRGAARAPERARARGGGALLPAGPLARGGGRADGHVSEARMRKLMEGRGPGRPGVAGKVGELVETIRDGGWCEEQGSLMRGLAFGILDPRGRALPARAGAPRECPACRAYVALAARPGRGAAAAGAPAGVLGAGALARARSRRRRAGAAGAARARARAARRRRGRAGRLRARRRAVGVGTAGRGRRRGRRLAAGGRPVGAKLAVGCLLALGVGAGCVGARRSAPSRAPAARRAHRRRVARGTARRAPRRRAHDARLPASAPRRASRRRMRVVGVELAAAPRRRSTPAGQGQPRVRARARLRGRLAAPRPPTPCSCLHAASAASRRLGSPSVDRSAAPSVAGGAPRRAGAAAAAARARRLGCGARAPAASAAQREFGIG